MKAAPVPKWIMFLVLATAIMATPGLPLLARSKPPVVEPPPPPPPPAPAGPVGLPAAVITDAAFYEAYVQRVAGLSPSFSDARSVADTLRSAASFDPKTLTRGAVAYGAIAALGSRSFVASVRAAGNSPENRRLLVDYLIADPAYAQSFDGSQLAAGLARRGLADGGLRLTALGRAVQQMAYQVQHQAWSKVEVVDRPGRLSAIEHGGVDAVPPTGERLDALARAATGIDVPVDAVEPAKPPFAPLVLRSVQLAALAALGEANDKTYSRLTSVTAESDTQSCLYRARLNLYQCLAVAKPEYEDIFCMGRHSLNDPGLCLARNSGVEIPVEVVPEKPAPAKKLIHGHRRHHA